MVLENYLEVKDLEPESILGNVAHLQQLSNQFGGGTEFPLELFAELIKSRTHCDTIVLLSGKK